MNFGTVATEQFGWKAWGS